MRKSIRLLLVVSALLGSVFALSGIAGAQDDNTNYPASGSETYSEVSNADLSKAPASAGAASAGASAEAATAEAPASSLAFTGSDVLVLSMIGGVAIVAGAAILVARRRTAQA